MFTAVIRHCMILTVAALIGGASMLFGCSEEQQRPTMSPAKVGVGAPLVRNLAEWDDYTGRFAAVDDVDVNSRVSGYLESIHFKDGDMVEQGDLLFIIDPRPFQVALDRARAQLVQAQTELDLAFKELERARPLIESSVISPQAFDESLQAKQAADAQVAVARAAVEQAKLDLDYTRITAPVSGRIGRREISVGNLVRGGAQSPTLLTTIVSHNPIHFYFDAGEREYLKYARLSLSGERPSARNSVNPVFLSLADEDGFPHRGYTDFVDNQIDRETGTLRGRAIFDNSHQLFIPGIFARIRIMGTGRRETILLPEEVVQSDQVRKFVFVVDGDNTLRYRQVELGPLLEGLRIIRKGLTPEDAVAMDNFQRLRVGVVIEPVPVDLDTQYGEVGFMPEDVPEGMPSGQKLDEESDDAPEDGSVDQGAAS